MTDTKAGAETASNIVETWCAADTVDFREQLTAIISRALLAERAAGKAEGRREAFEIANAADCYEDEHCRCLPIALAALRAKAEEP